MQNPLSRVTNNRNVILITISSLRADHVSSLGYSRGTTESFDNFAQQNILFAHAFATSSWQMPAMGSIFTSLYPSRHGATHINKGLDPNIPTLAEKLAENGFHTAGFCCNPRLSTEYGFARGFDYYDDYSIAMLLSNMSLDRTDSLDINKRRTNDLINDAAIRWVQNNTHKPFFLFVHYYDNHWDYLPPPPFNTLYDPDYTGDISGVEIAREPLYSNKPSAGDVEHIVALYDGEVTQTDQDLGELLACLRDAGAFENSLIIVMGDHGEQFYEHGHTSHHGIFDELITIPLAMLIPDVSGAKVMDAFASGIDIMPTILDYVGLPTPAACQGRSLNPLSAGLRDDRAPDCVFVEYTGGAIPDCFAVRCEEYKFIREKGSIYAYDLGADPGEQIKISKDAFNAEMNAKFEEVKHLLSPD